MLQPATLRFWNCDWSVNQQCWRGLPKKTGHALFILLPVFAFCCCCCYWLSAQTSHYCKSVSVPFERRRNSYNSPGADFSVILLPHAQTPKCRRNYPESNTLYLRKSVRKKRSSERWRRSQTTRKGFRFCQSRAERGIFFLPFSMRRSFVCREMTGKGIKRCALATPQWCHFWNRIGRFLA